MTYQTAKMLLDATGLPIPQFYDAVADVYRPVSTAFPFPTTPGAGGSSGNLALIGTGNATLATPTELVDPVTGKAAAVQIFHNADAQQLAATSYGLLTGGVAQLVNPANTLDRQRETGGNNVSNLGVATGTQQLKSPIATSLVGAVAAGAVTATLAATKMTNNGSPAWIGIGTALVVEFGTVNQETVIVTAVNYATNAVTVIGLGNGGANNGFKFAHAGASAVVAGAYNEAVDATAPEGGSGAGLPDF